MKILYTKDEIAEIEDDDLRQFVYSNLGDYILDAEFNTDNFATIIIEEKHEIFASIFDTGRKHFGKFDTEGFLPNWEVMTKSGKWFSVLYQLDNEGYGFSLNIKIGWFDEFMSRYPKKQKGQL